MRMLASVAAHVFLRLTAAAAGMGYVLLGTHAEAMQSSTFECVQLESQACEQQAAELEIFAGTES